MLRFLHLVIETAKLMRAAWGQTLQFAFSEKRD